MPQPDRSRTRPQATSFIDSEQRYFFDVEHHVHYLREVLAGDEITTRRSNRARRTDPLLHHMVGGGSVCFIHILERVDWQQATIRASARAPLGRHLWGWRP